jgi:hypothetical protein|tara:strand:- start:52 stop:243 length:192 start_codon:yes stop_codon:yes gene_type:complete
MKTPTEIVGITGGTSKTAQAVGITPQAVSNWLRRNHVPACYATQLIKAAAARGVSIGYADLIE